MLLARTVIAAPVVVDCLLCLPRSGVASIRNLVTTGGTLDCGDHLLARGLGTHHGLSRIGCCEDGLVGVARERLVAGGGVMI